MAGPMRKGQLGFLRPKWGAKEHPFHYATTEKNNKMRAMPAEEMQNPRFCDF
jgi:hypothetical protein